MAQRTVSWQGPELWLLTGSARFEVQVGPPLRDLPSSSDHALTMVYRSIGSRVQASLAADTLLVVRDGCVIGPWLPTELRHSKEHVLCITPDILPPDECVPTVCSGEVMGILAGFAQRRLQHESDNNGLAARAVERSHDENMDDGSEVYEEEHESDESDAGNDLSPELDAHRVDFIEGGEGLMERPEMEGTREMEEGTELESYRAAAAVYADDESSEREGECEDDREDDGNDPATCSPSAVDSISMADESIAESHTADVMPKPNSTTADHACVVRADQFVQEARNAWLQTKDPNRLPQDREILRGSLQQIFTSQSGTDLRGLRLAPSFDDENIGPAATAPTDAAPASSAPVDEERQDGPKAPRGRWASQPPVIMAAMAESPPEKKKKTAKPKRGGKLKSVEHGGPAGIVAPAEHLQRLEQLRVRTVAARTMWQTAGPLEALRLVASNKDAALSTSILRTVAGQLRTLDEIAIALTVAHPLLVTGMASTALKPVAAILQVAKHHATSPSEADASSSAKNRLLHEIRAVYAQLDSLRVNRDVAGSSFDEQFAFGQALALAREAGREAWRELDSDSYDAEAASVRGADPPRASGRREW